MFSSGNSNAQEAAQDKAVLLEILAKQNECISSLNTINKITAPAFEAVAKLQEVARALNENANQLNALLFEGAKFKDNTIIRKFQVLLNDFILQKKLTDVNIRICYVPPSKLAYLGEHMSEMDLILEKYREGDGELYSSLKADGLIVFFNQIQLNDGVVRGLYNNVLSKQNSLKARIEADPYLELVESAKEVFAKYQALPLSQVQTLNKVGVNKTPERKRRVYKPSRLKESFHI